MRDTDTEAEPEGITTFEQGIQALLRRAQTLDEAVQAGQPAEVLVPIATGMRPLFGRTVSLGVPIRTTLPKGALPAVSMASGYLEDAIRFMEERKTREQIHIHTQALVDTLKGVL